MSGIFSSLGSSVSQNPLAALFSGAGLFGNILQQRKQNQYVNNQLAYQKLLMPYAQDPTLLAKKAASAEQPLSAGLTEDVGNQVQGYAAERGLSTSPQIQNEIFAQAIAPYIQNEQQMALNSVIASLGAPGSAPPVNFGSPTNLSSLLQMLLKPIKSATGGGTPAAADTSGIDSSFPDIFSGTIGAPV